MPKYTIVYRVEHPDKPKRGTRQLWHQREHWHNLPSPAWDDWPREYEYVEMKINHVCGAESISQLKLWWKPEHWKSIKEEGFSIRKLKVESKYIKRRAHQVVFDRNKAVIVREL